MAQGSQPGVITGLFREDRANNDAALGSLTDVFREKLGTVALTSPVQSSWLQRVRDGKSPVNS